MASSWSRADQQFTTIAGAEYTIYYDVPLFESSIDQASIKIGTSQGGSDLLSESITTEGSYSHSFTATSGTSWVRFEQLSDGYSFGINNVIIYAVSSTSTEDRIEGGHLDRLLAGMGANAEVTREFLGDLAYLREPKLTPILEDLEREYGLSPATSINEETRRQQLHAIVYARSGNGSKDFLQTVLHNAGFTNLFVYDNSPPVDPRRFLEAPFEMLAGDPLSQAGEPGAQAGAGTGFLVVNGDIYSFQVDYTMLAGDPLAQAGEPTMLAGEYSGVTKIPVEYEIPADPIYWPFIFFIGGPATYNPDGGSLMYAGDTLAQAGEPTALAQFFDGELQSIEFADVPAERVEALKRLIVKYKPMHSWAGLLINPI